MRNRQRQVRSWHERNDPHEVPPPLEKTRQGPLVPALGEPVTGRVRISGRVLRSGRLGSVAGAGCGSRPRADDQRW
jgi:hypothetical protein